MIDSRSQDTKKSLKILKRVIKILICKILQSLHSGQNMMIGRKRIIIRFITGRKKPGNTLLGDILDTLVDLEYTSNEMIVIIFTNQNK